MPYAALVRTGAESPVRKVAVTTALVQTLKSSYRLGPAFRPIARVREERSQLDAYRAPRFVFIEVQGELRLLKDLSPGTFLKLAAEARHRDGWASTAPAG